MLKNKKTLILIICLFAFIMVVGGISYSYFTYNKEVVTATIESGSINIDFSNSSNSLNLSSVAPMNDETGKLSTNYIDFTVSGTADVEAIMYEIEVTNSNSNLNNYLKLYLTDQNNVEVTSPFLYSELYDALITGRKGIYQDLVEGNLDGTSRTTTNNYRLRVWIDENYTSTSSTNVTISVYLYAKNVDTTNLEKVTFNTQDGRSNGPIKFVTLGEEYGELPIPTRQGYTFLGWNGKNLVKNITSENFNVNATRVSYEFQNSDIQFVRINGNNSTNELDTYYRIFYKESISLTSNKSYMFSFYARSNNAVVTQYFGRHTSNGWDTSFKWNDSTTTYITGKHFDNDGNWHLVEEKVIIPTGVSSGIFQIGNDTPNLYGPNSYLDISNIQLEEGTESTEYEPYYVTSDTKVTQKKDHTLKAIWEPNS